MQTAVDVTRHDIHDGTCRGDRWYCFGKGKRLSKGDVDALRCPRVRLCTLRRRCGNDTANERHGANMRILSSDQVESCTVGKSWLGFGLVDAGKT